MRCAEEKNNLTPTYTAEDIAVLEGLEPVRKRPGMYIGGTGVEGLHHLLWEVLDNAIDEALAGYANNITLTLEDNNIASVFDDGRGIPVDVHKQTGKTALETVLTTLHAGGKFGGAGYKVSGGRHGVGVSVVNALSIMMRAEIFRDGKMHVQEYSRGEAKGPVEQTQDTEKHGTKITFQPDKEIFKDIEFDWKTIVSRCRQQAYLTKGVRLTIVDNRKQFVDHPREYHFYFEGESLPTCATSILTANHYTAPFIFKRSRATTNSRWQLVIAKISTNTFLLSPTILTLPTGNSIFLAFVPLSSRPE